MSEIKTFEFNSFQENTYIVFDDSKQCIIIDAGCYTEREKNTFADFIEKNELKPIRLISTHCHIDHILGNTFVSEKYGIGIEIHEDGVEFLRASIGYASVFGIEAEKIQKPSGFIKQGDIISFGNTILRVVDTPGHAAGSVCLINDSEKYLFSGDVLFRGSIGRTDLPTGDYDLLIESIQEKLMTLDDNYKVYCGHGPVTTIGFERKYNSFLQ